MQKIWTGVAASFGLLLLILDAKTALLGAAEGMELCIKSIVPSLFPFFVLSILLTGALTGAQIPFLRPLGKLLRMPRGSESIFLIGILGGYPVGAQAVAQSNISKAEARRMLGFCSIAGPSFLFGIVAMKLSDPAAPWALWLIHILSAVLTGILLPGGSYSTQVTTNKTEISLTDAVRKAIKILASVCAWVILFRIVIAFLTRWVLWILPDWLRITLCGILELANGCCTLDGITNEALRFTICSAILAFGGLCVAMQTASVTGSLGFGMYFPGKLLQTAISIVLSTLWQSMLLQTPPLQLPVIAVCMAIIVLLPMILRKIQKNSSIPVLHGV